MNQTFKYFLLKGTRRVSEHWVLWVIGWVHHIVYKLPQGILFYRVISKLLINFVDFLYVLLYDFFGLFFTVQEGVQVFCFCRDLIDFSCCRASIWGLFKTFWTIKLNVQRKLLRLVILKKSGTQNMKTRIVCPWWWEPDDAKWYLHEWLRRQDLWEGGPLAFRHLKSEC